MFESSTNTRSVWRIIPLVAAAACIFVLPFWIIPQLDLPEAPVSKSIFSGCEVNISGYAANTNTSNAVANISESAAGASISTTQSAFVGSVVNKQLRLNSQSLMHYKYVNTSNPFLICNAPKTGCTAWLIFFIYVNYGLLDDSAKLRRDPGFIYRERFHHIRNMHANIIAEKMSPAEFSSLIEPTKQFLVARNPYIRFLSSYQDWCARHKSNITFARFLSLYKTRGFEKAGFFGTLYNHIDPVSTFCNVENIGSAKVLRLEQEALWHEPFINEHGMKEMMAKFSASGNNLFTPRIDSSSFLFDYYDSILGTAPYPGTKLNSSHHRESASKLFEFYSPEIADEVSRLFYTDFAYFQYPLWDGDPATFRYA